MNAFKQIILILSVFCIALPVHAMESGNGEQGFFGSLWNAAKEHPAITVSAALAAGAGILAYKSIFSDKNRFDQTPLHSAISNGSVKEVQRLLDKGADIEARGNDYSDVTPLHAAVYRGSVEIVKILIERGANIEAKVGFWQMRPLHIAVSNGFTEIVRILLEKGAELEARAGKGTSALHGGCGKNGHTPLYIAIDKNLVEIAKLLLEKGADIKAKCGFGHLALYIAILNGSKEAVRLLVEKEADIQAKMNEYGDTPINFAASLGFVEIVQVLLENGADVGVQGRARQTPLLAAVNCFTKYSKNAVNTVKVLKFLLDKGAALDAKDESNNTALHYAAHYAPVEAVKFLLEKGADSQATNKWGETALHCAAEDGSKEVVSLLLEEGVDIAATTERGDTALHSAVQGYQRLEVIGLLLDNGADIEAKNNAGETPLCCAAAHGRGNENVISLLLKRGANITVQDNSGKMPLHHAASAIRLDAGNNVVSLFLKNGADIEAKDAFGRTALHYAEKLVKPLIEKGADFMVIDKAGDTPECCAAARGDEQTVEFLVKKGASIDNIGKCAIELLGKAIKGNDIEFVRNILQQGHFSSRSYKSAKIIKTSLAVFRQAHLPLDVRKEILSYLPQEVLTMNHARVLFNQGANLKELVAVCPFGWFKAMYDGAYDGEKAKFLEKIVPVIVDFRLSKIKEYSTNNSIFNFLRFCNNPAINAMLNPNNVEQHRAAIEANVRAAFDTAQKDAIENNIKQEGV